MVLIISLVANSPVCDLLDLLLAMRAYALTNTRCTPGRKGIIMRGWKPWRKRDEIADDKIDPYFRHVDGYKRNVHSVLHLSLVANRYPFAKKR